MFQVTTMSNLTQVALKLQLGLGFDNLEFGCDWFCLVYLFKNVQYALLCEYTKV